MPTFRVDQYGNVLYYHADPASPLAWNIDHWFPCSRGGLTVPSNLRILQWQVFKKKHNKLEFLIPWWDLQVGVSINQFLSIFASSNSDFRHRAFSLFFLEGESEELNDSQTVDSHIFPQHFIESKEQIGLAPAAVVLSRRESFDTSSTQRSHDINRRSCSNTPLTAARKLKTNMSKENENPNMVINTYQAIVMARNSFKHQEETTKMQGEIHKLDDEVNELRQKTDEEKVTVQDLELVLIKRRRRAEKCRRLAEAQSSYRSMLEKMIRDTMHQSVIYKEQVRLNQAASNALMARLEAQKAICDSSERELHRKFKQRDELESLIRPEWEQARKRSRMSDSLSEKGKDDKAVLYLPGNRSSTRLKGKMNEISLEEKDDKPFLCLPAIDTETPGPSHKALRVFLEEEQKASTNEEKEEEKEEEQQEIEEGKCEEFKKVIVAREDGNLIESKLHKLKIDEEDGTIDNIRVRVLLHESEGEEEEEEDEESRKLRGKGNVEKWLQMLLEDSQEPNLHNADEKNTSSKTDEIIGKLNLKYPNKEIKILRFPESVDEEGLKQIALEKKEEANIVDVEARKIQLNKQLTVGEREEEIGEVEARNTHLPNPPPPYKLTSRKSNGNVASLGGEGLMGSSTSTSTSTSTTFERKERRDKGGKEEDKGGLVRCGSSRSFRRIPSSPSIILRKGVDYCIRKKPKPLVIGDEEEDHHHHHHHHASTTTNNFIKSFKKAVNI